MMKTLQIAAVLTGISAFAVPALAQTPSNIVPGSETGIERNEAATRNAVADNAPAATGNPRANAMTDTIVPGNNSQIELNEAAERRSVAEGFAGDTRNGTGSAGSDILVPGSGTTFSPSEAPTGQDAVLQDQAVTTN